MPDRGRDNETGSKARPRSRSRVRRVKNGEEQPMSSRLKKIIRGIGRKSSRSLGDAASVASTSPAPSTVISVQPEVLKSTETSPAKTELDAELDQTSLQLVLLLLDPISRRFELLQLEFDSLRARVVDVIAQVPISVTDEAIRNQKYDGVISDNSERMDPSIRLSDFCKEKQVLVALPTGISIKDCIRLARPILSNAQVVEMLTHGGFDLSKWKRKDKPATPTPIAESKPRDLPEVPTPPRATKKEEVEKVTNGSTVYAFPFIVALAVLSVIIQAVHVHLATPIQVGVLLPPGTQRSKCGLFGYLPVKVSTTCKNSLLEVKEDGTVSILDEDGELNMLLVGGVCSKPNCVDGLVVETDGSVFVGGKRVKSLLAYGDSTTITPWPFQEAPKLKVKKFHLNT